jgi:hypothetical protein
MNKSMKTFSKNIPLVAAIVAIILAFAGIVALRNENATLCSDLSRTEEKNRALFALLVKLIAPGSLTLGELSPYVSEIEAKDIATRASEVIKASLPFDLETQFYPSGWMGDGEFDTKYLSFRHEGSTVDGKAVTVIRIEYRQGPKGWAGIYWQYPDGNWGKKPGKSLLGAKRISFYAKGERGGEIVEFKSGGITDYRYRDSFEKSLGKQPLSSSWTKYVIDLSKENLSSVIGAFAWVAAGSDNNGNIITYIANLMVE